MTLCLLDCLQAAGLQHHYARFTSVGVCDAAHLSALTMEDYPLLGISTMEERTRLFHLVRLLKTDMRNLVCEDDDGDYGDEGCTAVTSSYSNDRECDEDVYEDAAGSDRPSLVRRRLDFSCETPNQHHYLLTSPKHTVYTYVSDNRRFAPVQSRMSATDDDISVIFSSKWSNDPRTDVHSPLAGGNAKKDTMGATSLYDCHNRYSSKCDSSRKQTPRPASGTSKRLNNKPVGPTDRSRIFRLCRETNSDGASGHITKTTPVYEAESAAGYNYGLPHSSPPAFIRKRAGDQRISVCVRKRPLTYAESRRGEADVVTTPGGNCVIIHESKEAVDLTQYMLQHRFYFDHVFGDESSNDDVYQKTAYPLVQHMLHGGKATCFAYGQTGAGKTHTMLGSSPRRPGLYTLAVRDIFAHLSSHSHPPLLVYVSFFEIYCGQMYDLLDHRKRLFAREDGQKVVHIAGLQEVRVDSVSSLLEVISQGMGERTQGMSGVNPLSSRSHALLQIQLRGRNQQIAGRMWFVDLAGSERASDTKGPDRQSRMEGAEINQSLLALKECIRSLDQEQSHTPFRQSKLTQVLKNSFVGDSMTCMIANISPGHIATEHTLNTLRYADRVKELRRQVHLRGGRRRGKTAQAPQHNLSTGSSSTVGTRGKSPPKKAKLGKQKEAPGPTLHPTGLPMGEAILCSTPKNSRWGEESGPQGRNQIGFEHITPVRGWLGTADKREGLKIAKQVVREAKDERTFRRSVRCLQGRAGLVLEQPTNQQEENVSFAQGEFFFSHREILKVEKEEEIKLIEHLKQANSNERVKKADDKDKEKKKHLRWYHQQLQQLMPSNTSSSTTSVDVSSPSHCSSPPSSNQASHSSVLSPSSCSVFQQRSGISACGLLHHGLKEVLEQYRVQDPDTAVEEGGHLAVFNGERFVQLETNDNRNVEGDLMGVGKESRQPWEQTEARFGQDKAESEKNSLVKAASETRAKQENKRRGVMDGGERRWAWLPTTETQHAHRRPGVVPNTVEAQVCYNCDSEDTVDREGQTGSDVPATVLWSTVDSSRSVSTHSNTERSSLLNISPFGSSHHQPPAERPFSPVCEHTNTLTSQDQPRDVSLELKHSPNTLPLAEHEAQHGTPSGSHRVKTAVSFSELYESPAHAGVHHHPEVKLQVPVSPPDETNTDSLSCTMDPISMSLLHVDQQVATTSFLQGQQNNASVCLQKNDVKEKKLECAEKLRDFVENEESLIELPQSQSQCPLAFKTLTAVDFNKQRKDKWCATYNNCAKMQTMQGTEVPAPLANHSTYASMQMSIKPPVQNSGTTVASYSHVLTPNYITHMTPQHGLPASSISTQQLENVAGLNTGPSRCHTLLSQNVGDEKSLQKLYSPTDSNGQESISNQQVRPIIPLSTLENMNQAQWCVVRAHWEQLEEMEALCHKEGMLLCQQPDMAFREYINKLEKIMERKAQCVHSMRAQLQPYLSPNHSRQSHPLRDPHDDSTL